MKTIFVFMRISVSFHTGLNNIFPPKEFGFIQFTNGMVLSVNVKLSSCLLYPYRSIRSLSVCTLLIIQAVL